MYTVYFYLKVHCKCEFWVTLVLKTIKNFKKCLFVLPISTVLPGCPKYIFKQKSF